MKILFTNKNKGIDNNIKVLEINSSEINTSEEIFYLNKNEIPVIKYSDTEEMFLIKDASNKFIDNKKESLFIILDSDLISLGGGTGGDPRPYKVYTALLTQSGIGVPVATVLENTLGDIEFLREGDGVYKAKSNGLFTPLKTIYRVTIPEKVLGDGFGVANISAGLSSSILPFITYQGTTDVTKDDVLTYISHIEIKVYN